MTHRIEAIRQQVSDWRTSHPEACRVLLTAPDGTLDEVFATSENTITLLLELGWKIAPPEQSQEQKS
jgi:hypothetical protein